MTNPSITRPGKRERLVAAAAELVRRNGIETPTLARIAEAADVPPGNVYYYFKTRDELLAALVDRRRDEVRTLLCALDRHPGPRARLKGLADAWAAKVDDLVEHGCSVGCLASELGKTHPALAPIAAGMFEALLDWGEQQFRELGRSDAHGLATTLLAGIQGAAVLTHVLEDPDVMRREVQRLDRWIDEL